MGIISKQYLGKACAVRARHSGQKLTVPHALSTERVDLEVIRFPGFDGIVHLQSKSLLQVDTCSRCCCCFSSEQ